MLVCARLGRATAQPSPSAFVLALRLRPRRQTDHLIVVVTVLEIFTIREKIEELELFLLRLFNHLSQPWVKKLFAEIMLASTAPLDLYKVSGRENRPEQAKIKNIRAIVAGRHHADGDAHTCLACSVRGQEISRTQKIVVGEIDGQLLCVPDVGRYLNGKIRLVFAGEHLIRHLIQYLGQLGSVMLADSEHD